MLKIRVLGRGLLPNGLGLAPRKEFFNADFNTINSMLLQPGLTVEYMHPELKKPVVLSPKNAKKIFENFGIKEEKKPIRRIGKAPVKTSTPSLKPVEVKPSVIEDLPKVEENKEEFPVVDIAVHQHAANLETLEVPVGTEKIEVKSEYKPKKHK